jgi:sporulation protein YlmC with PRC-barrel domain
MGEMDIQSNTVVLGAKIGRVADLVLEIGNNPNHRLVIGSSNDDGLLLLKKYIFSKNVHGLKDFGCLHMT